jgi:FkbM family methyltransferase
LKIDRIRGHTFIADCLTPESQVVDLGMNEGRFASEIQDRYGCRVRGVEANPALAAKILQAGRVPCANLAIMGRKGEVDFYIDPDNSEASTLAQAGADRTQAVRVPALSLAEYLADQSLRAVDLLKIDIEGAELDLFGGIDGDTLADVKQISVEFHVFRFPEHLPTVRSVLKKMQQMGFSAIDFSRTWEDTLFINRRLIGLSGLDVVSLAWQKYRAGSARILRRQWDTAIERPDSSSNSASEAGSHLQKPPFALQ